MEKTQKRILLAEDDKWLRYGLRLLIEAEGYEVIEAEDGKDALIHMQLQNFDLVVADLKMPKVDGEQLLFLMRNKGMTTPVVMMMDYNPQTEDQESLKFENRISKPFSFFEFMDLIRATLKRAAAERKLKAMATSGLRV